ncbi:MAG: aspartate 1-decarboxylase [Candidatus Omnitrophica bacterium]|nr:Aspartate 1-decarboxylase [bacterium]NUN98829.1 aspartate 1-decarboxylase [Candidatus Omnitrophota bacterium]
MLRTFLRSKIHRATVTEAEVDYVGSVSIDEELMELAGLCEYEQVDVADLVNGERLTTYVIRAERGSRTIGINGAAALRITKGHKVIIFSYCQLAESEVPDHYPRLVFVDEDNNPVPGPLREEHAQVF